jgi:preprotein translocase subunit SecA
MFGIIKKIFGTAQTRKLRKYRRVVDQINRIEKDYQSLTEEQLIGKTTEFKARLKEGEALDALLPEAYAAVKNACRRLCGREIHVSGYDQKWDMVPYDVQLLGGIAMHYGNIAEMQTGEGKTLTASLPLYLNALTGMPVHLVTVNDYLAKRDCEWMGSIFSFLGLTVNSLTNDVPTHSRKEIYAADIVYGTSSEFGFDYLRDNSMAQKKEDQCQRGYYFAIIDEVDSILIDEARTPLIISGPSATSRQMYDDLKDDVADLVKMQKDLCNKLATDARKSLEKVDRLTEDVELRKLSKEEDIEEKEAYRKLWLVSKGTPQNKVLKRLKENPSIRAEIDKWDTYFYAEPNKSERSEALSELFIVIDERANEYELTDKGIKLWLSKKGEHQEEEENEFTMLDLGHEYALIDQDPLLDEQKKMLKKVELREKDSEQKERSHNLRQLLRAHLLMEKDVDYIVSEEKIIIIDENTGRPQPGRRFSDGLHQSIEAKEGVPIQSETQTYATITLQNYFRMFKKLSGMTGTAMTEANEFKEIYNLDVLAIPTHRPCCRKDDDDEIYMTEREKYNAILKDIQEIHEKGAPILIGTESVEISEKLSRILKQHKLPHTVLNAKQNDKEAQIIAEAGHRGAITLATNMAGRGTDIKLKDDTAELGGLHVLGTTRHQSRRIDRQLRGRSGRLGDPGYSKFYVSFEDALMRLFTSPRVTAFLQRFRPPEGEAIKAKALNRSIETAQKRIEQRNYTIRKHTLEYDDVMNKQRSEIYSFRNEVLHTEAPLEIAEEIIELVCIQMAEDHLAKENRESYLEWLMTHFPLTFEREEFNALKVEEIEQKAIEIVKSAFKQKIEYECSMIADVQSKLAINAKMTEPMLILSSVIRNILIHNIDEMWQEHLLAIDHLRTEVHLHAVGQKDPLLEFKHEAFHLFGRLSFNIKLNIAHALFKFQVVPPKSEVLLKTIEKKQKIIKPSAFKPSLSSFPEA